MIGQSQGLFQPILSSADEGTGNDVALRTEKVIHIADGQIGAFSRRNCLINGVIDLSGYSRWEMANLLLN